MPPVYSPAFAAGIPTKIQNFMALYNQSYPRAQSYDDCHNEFVQKRKNISNSQTLNLLSVNLYACLASWGMVSRKSLLMQHNYQVLTDAVKIVCNSKYDWLVDVDVYSSSFNEANYICDVIKIKNLLLSAFSQPAPSETLISKIMLITLGCIPAYDSKVKATMRQQNIKPILDCQGMVDIIEFAKQYKNEITAQMKIYNNQKINNVMINHSVMKYVDAILW